MSNLDQFYTKKEIAEKCLTVLREKVNINNYDCCLEPSAGTGSFYKILPINKRIGLDIEPKCEGVKKINYFDYNPDTSKKYLVIGNPPFGRVSSIAIKFFNKSAEFADCIAFIIPRTFKRVSVQNKLDLKFTLLYSEDLPLKPCCFTPEMSAKCCFQIWIKTTQQRKKIVYNSRHKDFTFLKYGPKDERGQPTPPDGADFVMKAYGSNCGELKFDDLSSLRPKSWHWIKSNISINTLKKRLNSLDYSISRDTVRQDSIGQKEVIYLYECKYN